MNKGEKTSRFDMEYLKDLATRINFSYRSYSNWRKGDLLRILSRKLTPDKVNTVVKLSFHSFSLAKLLIFRFISPFIFAEYLTVVSLISVLSPHPRL
jgi:hypothetical protein